MNLQTWADLPAAVALHPTLPHLAVVDCDGVAGVYDVSGGSCVPVATRTLAAPLTGPGRSLALGGPADRPLLAWLDATGAWLWAYTAHDGLADSPTRLADLDRFLGQRQGQPDRFTSVLLSGHPHGRWWIALGIAPGGWLVSNGRLSTHGGPRQQLADIAAHPTDGRLAILTTDGTLAVVEDPQPADPETDRLGPALLIEHHTACPLASTRPALLDLDLPLASPRFDLAARLLWASPDHLLAISLGADADHATNGRLDRRLHLCRFDGLDPVELDERALPDDLDFMVQLGEPPAPDATADDLVLLDPTPNGGARLDLRTRVRRHVSAQQLAEARPPGLTGHPEAADALLRLGLRWDGAEVYLDRLRPDLARAFGHDVRSAPLPATPSLDACRRHTGPVRADAAVPSPDGHVLILHQTDAADRLLLFAPAERPEPWVIAHPLLTLVPRHVQLRPTGRPPVTLRSLAFDAHSPYLALWRHPGGVELWSVHARDRLKAWSTPRWTASPRCRVLLRTEEPGYLPTVLLLAVVSEGPGHCTVEAGAVEFGERAVRSLGAHTFAEATDLAEITPGDHPDLTWSWRGQPVRFTPRAEP